MLRLLNFRCSFCSNPLDETHLAEQIVNADVEVEADRLCGEVANNVALSSETVAMKMRIKSLK